MNLHRSSMLASLILAAGALALPASPAHAADELGGNPVPGLCFLSQEAVFAQSKVGQSASTRLNQLAEQSRSQLASQRKPIQDDIAKFQQAAPNLSEDQRKSQGSALQQRMQAFEGKAGEQGQRLQLTRSKAMARIGQLAEPVISSVYKSHNCGVLMNRDAVLAGNMANDLTADVIKGLDAKSTSISFNLEPLPAGNGK